jgi:hypothetical protein
MTIKIYLDEDAQDGDFITALAFRGVDILTSNEAGMNGFSDLEQLEFATSEKRVLFSHNIGDFSALHSKYLTTEKQHFGIVLAHQRQFAIGEQTRRLLRLTGTLTVEEMQNRLEFLSAWSDIL